MTAQMTTYAEQQKRSAFAPSEDRNDVHPASTTLWHGSAGVRARRGSQHEVQPRWLRCHAGAVPGRRARQGSQHPFGPEGRLRVQCWQRRASAPGEDQNIAVVLPVPAGALAAPGLRARQGPQPQARHAIQEAEGQRRFSTPGEHRNTGGAWAAPTGWMEAGRPYWARIATRRRRRSLRRRPGGAGHSCSARVAIWWTAARKWAHLEALGVRAQPHRNWLLGEDKALIVEAPSVRGRRGSQRVPRLRSGS